MNNNIENRQELVQQYAILAQNFPIEMAKKSLEEVKEQASILLLLADSAETKAESKWLNELLEKTINHYTSETKRQCYIDAGASSDPMKYACLAYTFSSIRVKETRDKDTRETIREVVPCEKDIDLIDLHQWIREHVNARGIGADVTWDRAAAGLNASMARATAVDLGDDDTAQRLLDPTGYKKANGVDLTYALSDADWDKFVSIFHKMLGEEFNPTTQDWFTVYRTFVTRNKKKKNTVKAMNAVSFAASLKDVCHRILTDGHYTLETDILAKKK